MQIVANAPEDYRDLFLGFVGYINIGDTTPERSGFRLDGVIYYDVAADRNSSFGPFFGFFHEVGHMIDWALAPSEQYQKFTQRDELGVELKSALQRDVEGRLWELAGGIVVGVESPARIASLAPNTTTNYHNQRTVDNYHNYIRRSAVNNIMAGRVIDVEEDEVENLPPHEQFQWNLQNAMSNVLRTGSDQNPNNMINPSNIFGGITNNAVRGGVGHSYEHYWFDEQGNSTYFQNVEFFANHFAATMLNNESMLQNEREFFPTALPILEEVVVDMLGRRGR